jgi:galactokinase
VRINDDVRRQSFEFTISPNLAIASSHWGLYPAVVARRLARNFPGGLHGADISLASDLPPAAGMSSSSALVIAIYSVLSAVNRLSGRTEYQADIHTEEDLAGYLGCVENGQSYRSLVGDGGVGTFGGSEDHTAILASKAGHLKQYSFCPVKLERTLQLPGELVFVIGVSGIVADKTGSAKLRYNRASQAVGSILQAWRSQEGPLAATLAAAAASSLDAPARIRAMIRRTGTLEDSAWLLGRFEQFWAESEKIIPLASEALTRRDLRVFGELVDESQAAAESLLGNQIPETVWLARQARALGAFAASAFGAGFGGSVWALVSRKEAAGFTGRWREAYEHSTFKAARASEFLVTAAGPPAIRL